MYNSKQIINMEFIYKINKWHQVLFILIALFPICSHVKADSFNKYVGESFYLPIPKLSLSNAAIYDYTYEPTSHIDIVNQKYGEAKISSYFSGSEIVICNVYYYIQSPSGYRTYGRTTESHRVTCRDNNITLSTPQTEINVNEGVQLSYKFDNSYFASNAQVTYSISSASPSGCVSVSYSGYVKGLSSGTATIQAKSNVSSNVSSVTIRVKKIEATNVSITPNPASLYCDATLQMRASVSPSGASQNVVWSMYDGNPSCATISSSGVVSGYTPGTITVMAKADNGVYGLRTVSVMEPSFTKESSIPSNNSTNQNVFVTPSVTFSHTLYKDVNFDNITLKSSSGENIEGNSKISSKSIVFTPHRPLIANTKYILNIPANSVKNKWGTSYSTATTISFTTGNLEKLILSVSPASKFVKEGTEVKFNASNSKAAIYYTTDGTTPNENSSRYTNSVTINHDTELKAIAMLEGYENSDILINNYIISNVAVISVFPNNEQPLYNYSYIKPTITFSNRIVASSNSDKISLQRVGGGELDKQVIVCDSSIFIIPNNPLELGNVYKVSIPANAIKTWQGEYNEATSWTFATGDFIKQIAAQSPELGMALKSDNSLLVWGSQFNNGSYSDGSYEYNIIKQPTEFLNDVVEVSSGYMHHAAIKTDGSLWVWGRQYCGEFGNNSTNGAQLPTKVLSEGIKNVFAGSQTTAIIKNDNTLWMCGRNDFGQIGTGNTKVVTSFTKVLDDVQQVVSGWGVTFAITSNGDLYAWGRNNVYQLQNDSVAYETVPKVIMHDISHVSASLMPSKYFAAIRSNGDLLVWGGNSVSPQTISQNVVDVSVGKDYIEYIKSDGTLCAYGANNYGQLGDGTSNDTMSPVKILNGVKKVNSSKETTFALMNNGSVYSWGRDINNLLGQSNNYSEISLLPSQIIEGMPVSKLEGISLSKSQLTLSRDSYGAIPAYPIPYTADYENISWSSSNSVCATIDEEGIIHAISDGKTEITAIITDSQNNSFKAKCLLIVGDERDDIESIYTNSNIKIWTDKQILHIDNVRIGQHINVFMTDGACVYQGKANSANIAIPVIGNCVYIVKVDNTTEKILVK